MAVWRCTTHQLTLTGTASTTIPGHVQWALSGLSNPQVPGCELFSLGTPQPLIPGQSFHVHGSSANRMSRCTIIEVTPDG